MATKRKAVGNSKRFDIFKRDQFTCQYCGAHPPDVILELDHIEAVANGGSNDDHNLVTSCFNCNRGKAAKSLNVVPQSLPDKAKEITEKEAQLAGYREVIQAQQDRIEDDAWEVVYALFGNETESVRRDRLQSIRVFNARMELHIVVDAARIARAKYAYS